MIIYKDISTGSELISDSYDLKEIDGILYEADARMITVGGETFDTGANASAEEGAEDLDDQTQKVMDIVHSFQLQSIPMGKADYKAHVKSFVKKVKAYMAEKEAPEEDVKAFKEKGQAFMLKVLKNFDDYECYVGEQGITDNDDQQVVLLNYREDGVTPYFIFWKHALEGMKV